MSEAHETGDVIMPCKDGIYKLHKFGDELWVFKQHPDGQFVSVRTATTDDLNKFLDYGKPEVKNDSQV